MKHRAFQETKLILYAVLLGNGIFVQFLSPTRYLCDYEGYRCPMCGMRTAVAYIAKFQFKEAYESNHYIFIVIICVFLMLIDSLLILRDWHKK